MSALAAQTRLELVLLLRNGEQLLLTLGIPVLVLVFFGLVDVLPTGTGDPIDFLAPGVLALAVMSTAMVSLAIATGFERQSKVLKLLGATPLGRPRLLAAKTITVVAVEILQFAVLIPVAVVLGWEASGRWAPAVAAVVLGTVAFAGIGLLMAGTLRAEVTLAAANGLYLVLLLLGGMVVSLDDLPGLLAAVARVLPAGALSEALRASFAGDAAPARTWLVLALWALAAPLAAARWFRWE